MKLGLRSTGEKRGESFMSFIGFEVELEDSLAPQQRAKWGNNRADMFIHTYLMGEIFLWKWDENEINFHFLEPENIPLHCSYVY